MKYWYASCLGTIFSTNQILTFEESYCDMCGDFHQYIGVHKTEIEAIKSLEEPE